ncbi:MAG: tail-specific protease [Planctomycetota bacterium]|nr:MAG: tail-specific protease [Planctomycetota bacterium]
MHVSKSAIRLPLWIAVVCSLVTIVAPSALAVDRDNPLVEEMTRTRPMDRTIIKTVARIMDRQHFSKHPLDDEISERAFKQFLRALDPLKLYFLQSDIDEFSKNKTQLDDFAKAGDMDFARRVFLRFLQRVDERVEQAHRFIDMEHDFTVDEKLAVDRDKIDFAKSPQEAEDRMRRQIKYSLLVLESDRIRAQKEAEAGVQRDPSRNILTGDPLEDPKERLHRRYRNVKRRWHQTDADELLEIYLSSITTSFDPHTSYMSPDTLENFRIVMSLNLDGIGAQLTSEDGYTKLTSIIPGGAADKDGRLQPGDRIIAVGQGTDGEMVDVIDMKLDDVVDMIRGPAGTVVRLGVLPASGAETQIIEIVRAKIALEDSAARSEIVEYGKKPGSDQPFKVGYIDLPSFYMDMEAARNHKEGFRSTTRDVSRILSEFKDAGVDAVVLDLSRNGGGSLTEAINLTGLFIDRGPVVQVKDLTGHVEVYEDEAAGVAWEGPLVVLTSKESASASEILAGAIQDYGRGLIIGDPQTHGKGTVQSLVDLGQQLFGGAGEMGALKITIQQFYLPDGVSTQRRGVLSDIVLPAITASFDNSEADLDYALPNDQVRGARHLDYNLVNSTVLAQLREKSSQRVAQSEEFKKLLKRIALYEQQKNEEFVSLNRDEFLRRRAELDAQREEEEQLLDSQLPKKEVFHMDYYNREVLEIARDYVELISKLNLAQAG